MSLEQEVIRQKMINQLEDTTQRTQALRPEAWNQLRTIVTPWFRRFVVSESFRTLEEHVSTQNREITHLTDPIVYPSAPITATDAYLRSGQFQDFADHVLSVDPDEPWKAEWRFGVAEEALWYGHLSFSRDEDQQILVFSRFPITSQTRPLTISDERDHELVIEPEAFLDVIQDLHPKVTLDLARQIQTGRINEIAAGILRNEFVDLKKASSYQLELSRLQQLYNVWKEQQKEGD